MIWWWCGFQWIRIVPTIQLVPEHGLGQSMQTNLILRGDVELSGVVKPHSEGYLLGLPMMQNAGETQGRNEEGHHGHDPAHRPEQAAEEEEDC